MTGVTAFPVTDDQEVAGQLPFARSIDAHLVGRPALIVASETFGLALRQGPAGQRRIGGDFDLTFLVQDYDASATCFICELPDVRIEQMRLISQHAALEAEEYELT